MKNIILIGITFFIFSCGTSISNNNDPNSLKANFTASHQIGIIPLEVEFEDCSTADDIPIISWEWDFGDGYSSIERNPIHIYEEQGNFTVSLTVSDSLQSNTITRQHYINALIFDSTYIGTDQTLDIITWNLKEFPLAGDLTIESVSWMIEILNPDFIAFQEMWNVTAYNQLKNSLDGWEGYRSKNKSSDIPVLYKTSTIQLNNVQEIYVNDWWAFPRSPLVADITFMENDYTIINNHLKAFGGEENEARRLEACIKLKEYIDNNLADDNVILLGDLNDEITDPVSENVFGCFIDDPDNFQFADMGIAEGSSYYWSYPSWPSHIDHILITNELFDELGNSKILTLRIGDYYQNYSTTISDHRPVLIKLEI